MALRISLNESVFLRKGEKRVKDMEGDNKRERGEGKRQDSWKRGGERGKEWDRKEMRKRKQEEWNRKEMMKEEIVKK